MTASSIDFNIAFASAPSATASPRRSLGGGGRLEQPCDGTWLVTGLDELRGEPEDRRPETPLQICGMNRQGRNPAIQRLTQPPDSVPNRPEPTPAATVPRPR